MVDTIDLMKLQNLRKVSATIVDSLEQPPQRCQHKPKWRWDEDFMIVSVKRI